MMQTKATSIFKETYFVSDKLASQLSLLKTKIERHKTGTSRAKVSKEGDWEQQRTVWRTELGGGGGILGELA